MMSKVNDNKRDKQVYSKTNVNEFPYKIFPHKIQNLINDSRKYLGFPKDITATGILAALSIAIGKSIELKTPANYSVYCNIWLIIIAEKGTTKSPTINKTMWPLIKYAGNLSKNYENAIEEYEEKKNNGNKTQKRPILQEPIITDTTIEGIYKALKYHPKGIGIYADEAGGFLGNINKYNNGDDMNYYASLWSGIDVGKTRARSDSFRIEKPFLSFIGGLHPTRITKYFNQDMLEGGFMDRFMFEYPSDTTHKLITGKKADISFWEDYNEGIERLLDLRFNPSSPDPLIKVEQGEAYRLWVDYYNKLTKTLNILQPNDPGRGVIPKIKTMLGRFSILLHGLSVAYKGKGEMELITKEEIENAIILSDYYLKMNLKTYSLIESASPLDSLSNNKKEFYEALSEDDFALHDAVNISDRFNLSRRTVQRFLNEKKFFRRTQQGIYEKIL